MLTTLETKKYQNEPTIIILTVLEYETLETSSNSNMLTILEPQIRPVLVDNYHVDHSRIKRPSKSSEGNMVTTCETKPVSKLMDNHHFDHSRN